MTLIVRNVVADMTGTRLHAYTESLVEQPDRRWPCSPCCYFLSDIFLLPLQQFRSLSCQLDRQRFARKPCGLEISKKRAKYQVTTTSVQSKRALARTYLAVISDSYLRHYTLRPTAPSDFCGELRVLHTMYPLQAARDDP